MISLKTFASKTKTMGPSFMRNIYIFNIFDHLRAVNESKRKVWKGKNPCPSGVTFGNGTLNGIFDNPDFGKNPFFKKSENSQF